MSYSKKISHARAICVQTNALLVDGKWDSAKHDWALCAAVELGELISHLGFKYWREIEPDWKQAFIEIVDTLHFALSRADEIDFSEELLDESLQSTERDRLRLLADTKQMGPAERKAQALAAAKLVLAQLLEVNVETIGQAFHRTEMVRIITRLFDLAAHLGFGTDEVFMMYTAKITLTKFRQANDDKRGTKGRYLRHWGAQKMEDNQVMELILRDEPALAEDVEKLTQALSQAYVRLNGELPPGLKMSQSEADSFDSESIR